MSGIDSPDLSPANLSSPDISSPDLSSAGISSPDLSPKHAPNTLSDPTTLAQTLLTLFETSPLIPSKLVPQLLHSTAYFNTNTYTELIDNSVRLISSWPDNFKAQFVCAHPRIGEVSNLYALSAGEQASKRTSPEVLKRLWYLNAAYEHVYPGLRYITFVNGRSRAEIAREMEAKLGIGSDERDLSTFPVVSQEDQRWKDEVQRAVEDVGKIAKNRLKTLGVQEDGK